MYKLIPSIGSDRFSPLFFSCPFFFTQDNSSTKHGQIWEYFQSKRLLVLAAMDNGPCNNNI